MLNNIGLPGLLLIFLLFIFLLVWLIVRSGKRKAADRAEQKRIADALEEIANSKKNNHE